VYEETLTGRPHDTSVQKASSDNENVDAVLRHAQDVEPTESSFWCQEEQERHNSSCAVRPLKVLTSL